MKISDIQIDGFGIWSGLTLADLPPQGAVFYGPNEAGKTTLLQFIRAVLYGFSSERRARYLPPLRTELAGGTISAVIAGEGNLSIERRQSPRNALGAVEVVAADGTVQGESHLRRLLHDTDEATFNNVFAVGLRELQELGTLDDTDAAQWLYSLTAGLDRISLHEVLQELETSRTRLVGPDNEPSAIRDLLAQRARLMTEIDELRSLGDQHGQLVAEHGSCESRLAELDKTLAQRAAENRVRETAQLVFELWQRRAQLDAQIDAAGARDRWPADAVPRMKRLIATSKKRRLRARRLALQRADLTRQYRAIQVNQSLTSHAARIEALTDHESWIVAAEQEIAQLEATVAQLTAQQPADSALTTSSVHQHALPILRPAARTLRRATRRVKKSRRRLTLARRQVVDLQRRLQSAGGSSKPCADLTAAVGAAGQRVAQLRRRIQLDERLDQLSHTRDDLEEHVAGLTERQLPPLWMLLSTGTVFVLGFTLLLSGLFLPGSFTGSWGWPMAGLGLVGMACAVAAKSGIARSMSGRLESGQKQLALVQSQMLEAETQRDALDGALPAAGLLADRLQAAQQELGRLEELLPLEAQRQSAAQQASALRKIFKKARRRRQIARRRWGAALAAAGFSTTLRPCQLRETIASARELSTHQQKLADAQSALNRRRQELATLSGRIQQIVSSAGNVPASGKASEQLRQLRTELTEQEGLQRRRAALRRELRTLRRKGELLGRRLRRLNRRRQSLLAECQIADMDEFRRRAQAIARFAALVSDRDSAAREIAALVAGVADEQQIAQLISGRSAEQLRADTALSCEAIDAIRHKQQDLLHEHGRLAEQLHRLAHDRRPAAVRFELAQVEERLKQIVARWQSLTVTRKVLLAIKEDYEKNRQPETLREASEYLAELTAGHYRRVWTPLGENKLLVDAADGQSLGVDVLSRGTREQLFLSLRLALVGLFARRGAPLPLILDDVLVNFDARRAAAAAAVLRQFVERGHQLLMFTCHEHVAQLFKHQHFVVRRLPDNNQPGRDRPFDVEHVAAPRRARPRRAKSDSAPTAADDLLAANVWVTVVEPSTPVEAVAVDVEIEPRRRLDPPHQPARPPRRNTTASVVPELHAVRAVKSLDEPAAPIIIESEE